MDKPFRYLKDDEWQFLMAHAVVNKFQPNDVLLAEGTNPQGILVIRSGEVKVCRETAGFSIFISESGPGTIFGEMSFIEAEPADVSIIAMSEVESLFITHVQMQQEIDGNPGLFGRFYQSLAWILSQRLREMTGKVAWERRGDNWLGD